MTMPLGWTGSDDLSGEETIWHNEKVTGIWNRKVSEYQQITNKRVILNGSSAVYLKDLDDIIVMNSHSESKGQNMRVYSRYGMSYGMGRARGNSVGDIAFIFQGRPVIVFSQIPDPAGVARLAKSARKSAINMEKLRPNLIEITHPDLSKPESESPEYETPSRSEESIFPRSTEGSQCVHCNSYNTKGARFCNECGFTLQ